MTSKQLQQWQVGAGLVYSGSRLLLVRNNRGGGRVDWSPPGGVIDPGEDLVGGLTREVEEETGLQVQRWSDPIFAITAVAPDMGWELRVDTMVAESFVGSLSVDDPDGIVEQVEWVESERLAARLKMSPRWVTEPLMAWVSGSQTASFDYSVAGTKITELEVVRLY